MGREAVEKCDSALAELSARMRESPVVEAAIDCNGGEERRANDKGRR